MSAKVTRLKIGQQVRVGLYTYCTLLEVTASGKVVLRWTSDVDAITVVSPETAEVDAPARPHPLRRQS